MTDPSTPDRPGENEQSPGTPSTPPPPAAPAWGAPPPAPTSPSAPQQPDPEQPGSYAAPQQPPSAYPSPQQGGFPPPPSGGFPPPPSQHDAGFPPPPAGYGPGAGYQPPSSDIGAAFSWGWEKFKGNAGPLILSILLWGIGIGVIATIGFALAGAVAGTSSATQTETGFAAATSFGIGGIIVVSILTFLAAFVAQVALTNGYLTIADRGSASLGDFFKFRNIGQGIVLALVLGLASGLLSFTGIGSLLVAFFGAYAMFVVIDRGTGAIDAVKASVRLAIDNAGVTIVAILVSYAGVLVCGVGALVTAPLASLVLAYVYRRVTGGRVAA